MAWSGLAPGLLTGEWGGCQSNLLPWVAFVWDTWTLLRPEGDRFQGQLMEDHWMLPSSDAGTPATSAVRRRVLSLATVRRYLKHRRSDAYSQCDAEPIVRTTEHPLATSRSCAGEGSSETRRSWKCPTARSTASMDQRAYAQFLQRPSGLLPPSPELFHREKFPWSSGGYGCTGTLGFRGVPEPCSRGRPPGSSTEPMRVRGPSSPAPIYLAAFPPDFG